MSWEKIDDEYSRVKVPWGWLVQQQSDVMTPINTGYAQPELQRGYEYRASITFIFDPFHIWKP